MLCIPTCVARCPFRRGCLACQRAKLENQRDRLGHELSELRRDERVPQRCKLPVGQLQLPSHLLEAEAHVLARCYTCHLYRELLGPPDVLEETLQPARHRCAQRVGVKLLGPSIDDVDLGGLLGLGLRLGVWLGVWLGVRLGSCLWRAAQGALASARKVAWSNRPPGPANMPTWPPGSHYGEPLAMRGGMHRMRPGP